MLVERDVIKEGTVVFKITYDMVKEVANRKWSILPATVINHWGLVFNFDKIWDTFYDIDNDCIYICHTDFMPFTINNETIDPANIFEDYTIDELEEFGIIEDGDDSVVEAYMSEDDIDWDNISFEDVGIAALQDGAALNEVVESYNSLF